MKKRGRKLGSGKGRQVTTRSISMMPYQWQTIDQLRGKLSRGKWIAEKIFNHDSNRTNQNDDGRGIRPVSALDDR